MKKITKLGFAACASLLICAGCSEQKSEEKKDAKKEAPKMEAPKMEAPKAAPQKADAAPAPEAKPADAKDDAQAKAAANEKWDFLPKVVAQFGGKDISKDDFIKLIRQKLQNVPFDNPSVTKEMLMEAAPSIAQDLIDGMLLLQLAEKSGIKPSEELVAAAFDAMHSSLPPEQLEAFKKQLEASGTNLDQYKDKVKKEKAAQEGVAIDKWIKENVVSKVSVSDADIQDFYNKNKDGFKENEKAKVSHILIRPEAATDEAKAAAKKKAEDLLKKITSGALAFDKAAEQESMCPLSKTKKGELPDIERGGMFAKMMGQEFENAVFALKDGQTSGVVDTPNGFDIIKLHSKTPAKERPLDGEVKEYIKNMLSKQKVDKEIKDLLEKEREKQGVKIFLETAKKACPPACGDAACGTPAAKGPEAAAAAAEAPKKAEAAKESKAAAPAKAPKKTEAKPKAAAQSKE